MKELSAAYSGNHQLLQCPGKASFSLPLPDVIPTTSISTWQLLSKYHNMCEQSFSSLGPRSVSVTVSHQWFVGLTVDWCLMAGCHAMHSHCSWMVYVTLPPLTRCCMSSIDISCKLLTQAGRQSDDDVKHLASHTRLTVTNGSKIKTH